MPEFKLVSTSGRRRGADALRWSEFENHMKAHIVLGHAVSVKLDQYGEAKCDCESVDA